MISLGDLYNVLSAVVPLYVAMFLAFASVRWRKVFTPEQCAGINRFVAIFAIPLLSFEFISRINPFKMNFRFVAADAVSKVLVLSLLLVWARFCRRGSLDWSITLFSLSTLPNTLVMGIPLLKSMYGDEQEGLMIQVVVLQSIIWYTILLVLFEYRAARSAILQQENGEPVPDSGRLSMEEQRAQELRIFVWPCCCCNSRGKRSVQVFNGGEESDQREGDDEAAVDSTTQSGMIRSILQMVVSKLIRNPNTYACLLGLSWALASSRWSLKKPRIIDNSVTILSNAGLGMAMFSLGLFMALQPRIIPCGRKLAVCGMIMRFLVGPAVMAIASFGVGIRGTTLRVSIVQAALPQGIVPFVFAREYNLHPEVLSTGVIFGMIVSLPVTVLYYVLFGL
ncbi:auxin efflux carrier component 3-like [Zingiber officinale]|uniref:auxin efflux carrier component 3-like n=1 Tax=Zingiber officinale TaxID=94328 RepID=UPI001C4B9BBC|nr:auxin efflux carrier component 3-like [Zingiber officinale]